MTYPSLPFPELLSRRRGLPRLRAAKVALTLLAVAGSILGFLLYIGLFWGNIRVVVPGQVYRSAQLPPERLEQLIRDEGLRTVISLRGGDPGDRWFRREQAACDRHDVRLEVVRLTATTLPRPEQVQRLVRLFDSVPRPVLFHCRAGADRAGLAATVYLHLEEGRSIRAARENGLTWRYGHFPVAAEVAMDRFFDLYQRSGKPFRAWLQEDYPAIYARESSRS